MYDVGLALPDHIPPFIIFMYIYTSCMSVVKVFVLECMNVHVHTCLFYLLRAGVTMASGTVRGAW